MKRFRFPHPDRWVIRLVIPMILIGATAIGVNVWAYSSRHTIRPVTAATTQPTKQATTPAAPAQAAPTTAPVAPAKPAPATPARQAPSPAAAAQTVAAAAPTPSSTVSGLQPTTAATPAAGSTSATPAPGPSTPTAPSSTPPASTTRYSSTNWSGYVATSGSFTAVAGAWTVPSPASTSSTANSLDAAWIGIGGVTSSDLIQIGTADVVAPDGTITVSAFYELLPDSAQFITNLSVVSGDHMSASITQLTGSTWSVSISDQTSGQSYATTLTYASSLSSAEWIEEDPSYSDGTMTPLDNFGTINFSGCTATNAGGTQTAAALGSSSITLVSSHGRTLATPSSLVGGAFSVSHS